MKYKISFFLNNIKIDYLYYPDNSTKRTVKKLKIQIDKKPEIHKSKWKNCDCKDCLEKIAVKNDNK